VTGQEERARAILARTILDDALQPGEQVLWTGHPDPQRLVQIERKWWPGGIALILLAAWSFWRADATVLAAILLLFGLNALTLPFRAARAASGILYAVTDKQVRIVDAARLSPMQTYPFTALQLQLVRPKGMAEDRGDLLLRRRDFFPAAIEGVFRQRRPAFFAIPSPDEVAVIIRQEALRYAHRA
jgi:hypothetical protein